MNSAVDNFKAAKDFIQSIWDDLNERDLLAEKDHIRFSNAVQRIDEIILELQAPKWSTQTPKKFIR